MAVTDTQIQNSFDQDVRPLCNTLVVLLQRLNQFAAGADDLYAGINDSSWADARTDGPPHLAEKSDWYAFNTFQTMLKKCIAGTATSQDIADLAAQWAIVQKLATRG